jgi:response regulator RpfG family c-di-GMP phosphodiesterase
MSFPICGCLLKAEKEIASPCAVIAGPLGVLVVEDSPDNRLLIRGYLDKLSCEVDEAENGEIGINKFMAAPMTSC